MSSFLCGVLSYGLDFYRLEQEQVSARSNAREWSEVPCVKPWQTEKGRASARKAFVEAALAGSRDVDFWIGIMEREGITLSKEATWIKKAFLNDPVFSVEKFTKLSHALRRQIYFVARAFSSEKVVKKISPFMKIEVLCTPPNRSLFTIDMDTLTVRKTIQNHLNDLRKNGALLTKYEFDKLDKRTYICKTDADFGRILGKLFIEKVAKQNGLKHIKVAKKIVVLGKYSDGNNQSIDMSFTINDLELRAEKNIQIYAERIKQVQRKLSLEEAIEFIIAVEKTGPKELWRDNYFITKDGVYFVDTEISTFAPDRPDFKQMRSLSKLVHTKDVSKFLAVCNKREKAYHKMEKMREKQDKAYQRALANPYVNFARIFQKQTFTFSLPA